MKKLFISCPMKGRSEEDIKKTYVKLKGIAEAAFGEKFEVIETFIKNDPPATDNIAIWMLGESIKKMASADYYIGLETAGSRIARERFRGCIVENTVAESYGIPSFLVAMNVVAPDVFEKEES